MGASDGTESRSPFSAGAPPDNLSLASPTFSNLVFLQKFLSILHLSLLELGLEEDLEGYNVLALFLPGQIHIPKFTLS